MSSHAAHRPVVFAAAWLWLGVAPAQPSTPAPPPLASPAPAQDPLPAPAPEACCGAVVAVLDEELLRGLPSARDWTGLLETLEPMAVFDRIAGAGLYPAQPRAFSLRGTSFTQNAFVLDGADVSEPARGGAPLFLADVDALGRVSTTSALAPASLGSTGATVELAAREPGARWAGSIQAHGVPAGLQSGPDPAAPPAVARFGSLADVSGRVSGPLAGERLRLLLAAHVGIVGRIERDHPIARDRLLSGCARLVLRAGARDDLRLLAAVQGLERPLAGAAGLEGEAAREDARAGGATLGWARSGVHASLSAFAGWWAASASPRAPAAAGPRVVERLVNGPVPLLVLSSGGSRASWSAGGAARFATAALGPLTHAPRLGIDLRRAQSVDEPGPVDAIAERVDGLPARVWQYTWPGAAPRRQATALTAWASDHVAWGDRLQLDAGLRLEHARGRAEGAPTVASWTTLVPRVSTRLRLSEAGQLSLLGGYAEYTHRLLLDWLAFGDPAAPYASVYRWSDDDGDGRFSTGERGVLVARVGPGAADGTLAALDPALRPPRTREWVAGVGAQPGRGWTISLLGFDRREQDLVESVNVGAPASAYDVRYLPDPGGDIASPADDQLLPVFDRRAESFGRDRYLLTNPPGHGTRHQGLELRAQKTLGARFAFLGGATASRTDTEGASRGFRVNENDAGVVGELYDDPNADVYARGRGFFDRAFTIKLGAVWRAPHELRLGVVARYQDGQAFARVVIVPDLAQGPELVQATPRGQTPPTGAVDPQGRPLTASGHRFSYTLTLDGRLEKRVRLGELRAALVAEAFNLLNARNEVEEDPVWGERFRDPTAVQPPRAFRLGARLDF